MTTTRKFGSKNMREIHFPDGRSVLFSYATPVVVCDNKGHFFLTTKKHSVTTTRQIGFFFSTARQEGRINSATKVFDVSQDTIDTLVSEIRKENRE